jgi:hypothetical protein
MKKNFVLQNLDRSYGFSLFYTFILFYQIFSFLYKF